MIRPAETALIIVDMQNAYASPGGYLDLAGFDISGAAPAIDKITRLATAARARRHAGDLLPERLGRRLCRGRRARLAQLAQVECAQDHARSGPSCRASCWPRAAGTTSWSRRCRRSPATSSSRKPRYSAFFNTNLDSLLRARGIRSLVFTGIATNVCVGVDPARRLLPRVFRRRAARRHAPCRARLHPAGARCYNIENFFGWVSSVDEFRTALQANINPTGDLKGRDLMPKTAIIPPGSGHDAGALLARRHGRRHRLCLGHAGARRGDQRRPCRRRRQADRATCSSTIKSVIETAGGTMADVTFNHDLHHRLGELRARSTASTRKYFPGDKPARYCIQCGLVKKEALVEIATVAHIGKQS